MLLLRVGSGGWLGQGYRNVPPEHPFNCGTEVYGAPQGERSPPPPLRLQDGCGSGFRVGISILPTGLWAALGRRREAKGTSVSFQKHFTNALSHFHVCMAWYRYHPAWRKRNSICSLTFVLSWRGARSDARYEIAISGKKTCLQTYSPKK